MPHSGVWHVHPDAVIGGLWPYARSGACEPPPPLPLRAACLQTRNQGRACLEGAHAHARTRAPKIVCV
jgi:hypothetical protein